MDALLNKVTKGDCLEVMKRIPDGSVDMILADLPYGTTACKWDTIIPFEPLWEEYERVIKERGAIVLTAAQPFTSALIMSNPELFKYEWIWDKEVAGGGLLAKRQPLRQHESIVVFYKKQCTYNRQMTVSNNPNFKNKRGKGSTFGDIYGNQISNKVTKEKLKNPVSIISFNKQAKECNSSNRVHPTQKPVALFEYLIKTYTNEGEVVLDNVIGSGTTAVAAINTGRNFIGIEKEPEYVDIARRRIDEAVAKKGAE